MPRSVRGPLGRVKRPTLGLLEPGGAGRRQDPRSGRFVPPLTSTKGSTSMNRRLPVLALASALLLAAPVAVAAAEPALTATVIPGQEIDVVGSGFPADADVAPRDPAQRRRRRVADAQDRRDRRLHGHDRRRSRARRRLHPDRDVRIGHGHGRGAGGRDGGRRRDGRASVDPRRRPTRLRACRCATGFIRGVPATGRRRSWSSLGSRRASPPGTASERRIASLRGASWPAAESPPRRSRRVGPCVERGRSSPFRRVSSAR